MLLQLYRDVVLAVGAPTTGRLLGSGSFKLYTIEQPWADNRKGHSCVPLGRYMLIPYVSPKHGATWCLHAPPLGVYAGFGTWVGPPEARNLCELHSANWASQLEGCIAVGMDKRPMLNPQTGAVEPAIVNSRCAVAELIHFLGSMSSGHFLDIA